MISFCVLWCNHDIIDIQVVQLSLTRWPEGCKLPLHWMRFRKRMGSRRRKRRERPTALKRKVELTFIVSTSHITHHHNLTSSHPHTSLDHTLYPTYILTHPHLLPPSHITLSPPNIPHTLTPHPHTLTSHPHIFTCTYNTMYHTQLSHLLITLYP